ncbi:hypothetical protein CSKR_106843 [Clonorchis sinensis]|uniref:Uncharacterized protein n=1 Tax=Clonorchis sinensis TaxID=79923 RepID=A0A3R7DC92_CLOSI|nr:hypothetical protein CSKR_106843 [Clonorchis sinensis]
MSVFANFVQFGSKWNILSTETRGLRLRKHWTRVSLLLKLISSAYPVALPGFELRTSDIRGEHMLPLLHQITLGASEFSRLNRRTCSRSSEVMVCQRIERRPSNCSRCDDRLTHQSGSIRSAKTKHPWISSGIFIEGYKDIILLQSIIRSTP